MGNDTRQRTVLSELLRVLDIKHRGVYRLEITATPNETVATVHRQGRDGSVAVHRYVYGPDHLRRVEG